MNYPAEIKIGSHSYKIQYESCLKANSSVRIKKGVVILKLSRFVAYRKRDEIVEKFLKWAVKKLSKIKYDFVNPEYKNGSCVCTHNKIYEIAVFYEKRKNISAFLRNGNVIEIYLPVVENGLNNRTNESLNKIKYCAEKIIMDDQTLYLCEVINELNQLFFQSDYKLCRFKRMNHRFGSLSSKKNLNIAYRLLFAPREVFRYVCVHELAHLKEFNHSKRFWDLVAASVPEYKKFEKWLKQNGFCLG